MMRLTARSYTVLFLITALPLGIVLACSAISTEPATPTTSHANATTGTGLAASITPGSPESTPTPSRMPTVAGTPIAQTEPREGSSLRRPSDIEIAFGTRIPDLPPGDYLLYRDPATRGLSYSNLSNSGSGLIFSIVPPYDVYPFIEGKVSRYVIGRERSDLSRYVIDLWDQTVMKVEPVCSDGNYALSPRDVQMAALCPDTVDEDEATVRLQIISTIDGLATELVAPFWGRAFALPKELFWISEDQLVYSDRPDGEPCVVSSVNLVVRCAEELRDKPIIDATRGWILSHSSRSDLRTVEVHSSDCLLGEGNCSLASALVPEKPGEAQLLWSPDLSKLAMVNGAGPSSFTTDIGYFSTDTWSWNLISSLPGDYLLVDWCPDSLCLLVRENTQEGGLLVYLDGSSQVFSLGRPIQMTKVP